MGFALLKTSSLQERLEVLKGSVSKESNKLLG